jgi:hypothetical protein
MEDKIIIKLVECTDSDVEYGALIMPKNLIKVVQKEIYNIKEIFDEEGFYDWSIEDIMKKLQEKYPEVEVASYEANNYIEI